MKEWYVQIASPRTPYIWHPVGFCQWESLRGKHSERNEVLHVFIPEFFLSDSHSGSSCALLLPYFLFDGLFTERAALSVKANTW